MSSTRACLLCGEQWSLDDIIMPCTPGQETAFNVCPDCDGQHNISDMNDNGEIILTKHGAKRVGEALIRIIIDEMDDVVHVARYIGDMPAHGVIIDLMNKLEKILQDGAKKKRVKKITRKLVLK